MCRAARAQNTSPMTFETQRGNWSRAGRRLPICRARGDAVCKPWISLGPCDMSTYIYTRLRDASAAAVHGLSISLASRSKCAAGRRRLHLRQRNLAPPSCTRHAQLRAAELLAAYHTSIDRCCASRDVRGCAARGCCCASPQLITLLRSQHRTW